jgi:hypothetical protein
MWCLRFEKTITQTSVCHLLRAPAFHRNRSGSERAVFTTLASPVTVSSVVEFSGQGHAVMWYTHTHTHTYDISATHGACMELFKSFPTSTCFCKRREIFESPCIFPALCLEFLGSNLDLVTSFVVPYSVYVYPVRSGGSSGLWWLQYRPLKRR